jgi:hypothetical protein
VARKFTVQGRWPQFFVDLGIMGHTWGSTEHKDAANRAEDSPQPRKGPEFRKIPNYRGEKGGDPGLPRRRIFTLWLSLFTMNIPVGSPFYFSFEEGSGGHERNRWTTRNLRPSNASETGAGRRESKGWL